MRTKVSELETFRKSVKLMIPQMEKSEIVKHFLKQKFLDPPSTPRLIECKMVGGIRC